MGSWCGSEIGLLLAVLCSPLGPEVGWASDGQVQCSVVVGWTAEHMSKMEAASEEIHTGTLVGVRLNHQFGAEDPCPVACTRRWPQVRAPATVWSSNSECRQRVHIRLSSRRSWGLGAGFPRVVPTASNCPAFAEGAIVFNANTLWVGGKQLGYDFCGAVWGAVWTPMARNTFQASIWDGKSSCSPWSPPHASPAAGGHWSLPQPRDPEGNQSSSLYGYIFLTRYWPVWPSMWRRR